MKYLIAGGGTGGHIYPALAIAAALRSLDEAAEFLFVGTGHGLEADLVVEAQDIEAVILGLQGIPLPIRFGAGGLS